jgi:hypothetical protein
MAMGLRGGSIRFLWPIEILHPFTLLVSPAVLSTDADGAR